MNVDFSKKINFETIVSKHSLEKQKQYRNGFAKIHSTKRIPKQMEIMQKTNEVKYDDDLKPRNLFNPSWELKAAGSYIGQWLNDWARAVVQGYMVGYNTTRLCQVLTESWRSLINPLIIVWDGSNHDAHQYPQLIKILDNLLIEALFERAYQDCVDFPQHCDLIKQQLKEAITALKIHCYYNDTTIKKKFQRVLKVEMNGTVFSGHPTRTTWGNTMRVLSFAHFIAYLAGVPKSCIKIHASGDDLLIFIEKEYKDIFEHYYKQVYIHEQILQDKISHGLGQVGKTYKVTTTEIDFLSKWGFVYQGTVILNRQVGRVLLSGNDTNRIGKHINEKEFNWAITASVESYGLQYPVIKQYINLRKKVLDHWKPRRLDKFQDFVEMRYLKEHKNEYLYEELGMSEAIRVQMGWELTCLMQSDIEKSMDYYQYLRTKNF